jgi:hypothetical protein
MKCTKIGYTPRVAALQDKYGMFLTRPAVTEDGMCLVLFQRPEEIERGD